MTRAMTPLGAVVRGMVAGAVGTLAMDAVWYRRYRRGGGTDSFPRWELAIGLDSWENAAAPAQVGRRITEGLFQRELPAKYASPMTNLTHWGYGIGWGGLYGIVAGTAGPLKAYLGLSLGATVWLSSYVVLPLAGLYQPIWKYDLPTLGRDLTAHLTYGGATGVSFAALAVAT